MASHQDLPDDWWVHWRERRRKRVDEVVEPSRTQAQVSTRLTLYANGYVFIASSLLATLEIARWVSRFKCSWTPTALSFYGEISTGISSFTLRIYMTLALSHLPQSCEQSAICKAFFSVALSYRTIWNKHGSNSYPANRVIKTLVSYRLFFSFDPLIEFFPRSFIINHCLDLMLFATSWSILQLCSLSSRVYVFAIGLKSLSRTVRPSWHDTWGHLFSVWGKINYKRFLITK